MTKLFQYADDFLVFTFADDLEDARLRLSQKIRQFVALGKDLRLSFNPEKSSTIYFAKGGRKQINLKLGNVEIKQAKMISFLGVKVKDSLTTAVHYERTIEGAKNKISWFKWVNSQKFGVHSKTAVKLYRMYIRPKIEYARSSMAHSPMTINKKISAFQNAFLRRCLGATPSTPVVALYVLANELSPRY